MKSTDTIKLSDGQTATIIRGEESEFKNIYIVQLQNKQIRVVDKKTLTLAHGVSDIRGRHANRR
jgi:hypothetical protein